MTPTPEQVRKIIAFLNAELKPDSADDKEARRALADVLRYGKLDPGLRHQLAAYFDSDSECSLRLRVEHRRKGKPSDAALENEIAEFIWSSVRSGLGVDNAVHLASKKFKRSERHIWRIWAHWHPILKRRYRCDLADNPFDPF